MVVCGKILLSAVVSETGFGGVEVALRQLCVSFGAAVMSVSSAVGGESTGVGSLMLFLAWSARCGGASVRFNS